MKAHRELINRFYQAFQQRDAAAMGSCYHAEARFSDPAFPDLDVEGARAMWSMLCARAKDLKLEYRDILASQAQGSAHWEAWYTFTATGRPVHNIIEARFEFRDGLILRHVDNFDFARWAGQALGFSGKLLGRTRFLQHKVQKQAATNLAAWRAKAAD